jgi:hypothetical protein
MSMSHKTWCTACPITFHVRLSLGPDGLSIEVSLTSRQFRAVEVGAMVEPLAVAWHAVKAGKLQKGGKALVIGGWSAFLSRSNQEH